MFGSTLINLLRKDRKMSIIIGEKAPNFTLLSNKLKNISLNDFEGKQNVIVLFFPLVNTGTCEKELCTMRDGMAIYENLEAQVLAISVDSPFSQNLWAEKQKFTFPLLSDFNKEVCKKYGAYYDVFVPGKLDFNGVAKRSAFVIDKEGIVRYTEILEDASLEPNYEAIQETLKSL